MGDFQDAPSEGEEDPKEFAFVYGLSTLKEGVIVRCCILDRSDGRGNPEVLGVRVTIACTIADRNLVGELWRG